jgi:UDP:flavonoid glycosyltransferase YjiC (YdhE family)
MKFVIFSASHSLSHIAKSLAVAEVLQARGHEVVLGLAGARTPFLEGRGIPYRSLADIQDGDGSGFPTADWFRNPRRLKICIREEVSLLKELRPDRVLGVFSFTARAAAQLAGVPYDALTCGCMLPEFEDVLGFGTEAEGWEAQAHSLRTFFGFCGRRASIGLAKLGLKAVPELRCMLRGDRTFLWDFPEFTPLPAGTEALHVGPIFWNGWPYDMDKVAELLASPLPLAIVTFGTCVNSVVASNRLVDILIDMGFQVVLTTGGQSPLPVGDRPRLTVCNFAPLHLLFGKASLTVCHGGQLTVFEALAGRSPVLVLPLQPEQAHNGLCLARLGCGGNLVGPQPFLGDSRAYTDAFEAMSDRSLRTMVETFLDDPSLPGRLERTQSIIQSYRGAETLANWMERG